MLIRWRYSSSEPEFPKSSKLWMSFLIFIDAFYVKKNIGTFSFAGSSNLLCLSSI